MIAENGADLGYGFLFRFIEGLEIRHEAHVVPELFHIAHTGEHHHYAREPCCETDGIAGVGTAVQTVEDCLCPLRQIYQGAALYGLHDNDGLSVLPTDLVALPGLHLGVLVVCVVELELHHFHLGIGRENLVQHFGLVMEGHAKMPNLSFRFQLQGRLKGPGVPVVGHPLFAQGVHQIEVKVVNAAGRKLGLEERTNVRLGIKIVAGELVGQNIAVSGIPGCQTLPDGQLTFPV